MVAHSIVVAHLDRVDILHTLHTLINSVGDFIAVSSADHDKKKVSWSSYESVLSDSHG